MNPAPLPQPAPFTCPDCGAGLESKPDFCPHCGARVNESGRSPLDVGAIIVLTIGLIVFGAIGACSGLLVFQAFGPQRGFGSPPGPISAHDLLIFSVPCLIFGLAGFGWCLLPFFRRKR